VFKGMRMAGRDGGKTVTIENLLIIKIIPEQHLIVVKGSVPGAKGSYLMIRKQWK
jgi:large subunit ribosomal protein L3